MSKSLFSVTQNPLTGGGIFSALQSLDPPWVDEDIALQLDLSYYGNISGGKVVSPLIDRILTASKLTTADMATLAGVIMAINKERWTREWATRSAEYDPIQNYNMTEKMTDDETVTEYGRSHTRTDNLAHTETRTDNLTRIIDNQEITTPNLTSTSQQATRGFNSSSDVNTDKETATNTGTNRVDTDGTEHNTGTQGTTGSNTGTQTDADTGSDTSTRNYTLTRSGNIGVTTSQQMLQSERELWMWSYFYDVVFPDVDEVLTIPIYADGEDADGTGGGIIPTGTIAIITNGNYDVTTYARANVSVPLPSGAVNITTNGRHDVTSYEFADVLVPNSYTESDEGKVVSSGALVAQAARTITENGTYDTTLINSITTDIHTGVNVLRGESDPTSQSGSNGDIYLKITHPIVYDSELGFSCDSAYYVNSTTQKLSQQSSAFYKTVAGGCIAVYYHKEVYYGPILISTVQDYVKYTSNTSPAANRYVTIDGVKWYYSTDNSWSTAKDPNATIPLFESATGDVAKDIPDILDAAFYQPGDVSADYIKVVNVYTKSNNEWIGLVGEIIHV